MIFSYYYESGSAFKIKLNKMILWHQLLMSSFMFSNMQFCVVLLRTETIVLTRFIFVIKLEESNLNIRLKTLMKVKEIALAKMEISLLKY